MMLKRVAVYSVIAVIVFVAALAYVSRKDIWRFNSGDPALWHRAAAVETTASSIGVTPWPPKEGEKYPDLELINTDGEMVRLSSFYGKVLLIEPVGMSCPACQTFSGANVVGTFGGTGAQKDVMPVEDFIVKRANKDFRAFDERFQVIQIIFYNRDLEAPKPKELRQWAEHFKSGRKANVVVLGGTPEMTGAETMRMIPSFQVVDRSGTLRYEHRGSSRDFDKFAAMLRAIPRMVDRPPESLPTLDSELVRKVAQQFLDQPVSPIPTDKNATVNEDVVREYRAYCKQMFSQAYRKYGRKNPRWDRHALQALDAVIPNLVYLDGSKISFDDEVVTACQTAISAGCEDPLLMTCQAYALRDAGDTDAAETVSRKAVQRFADTEYPASSRLHATSMLASLLAGHDQPASLAEAARFANQLVYEIAEACAEGNLTPMQKRCFRGDIRRALGDPLQMRLWQLVDAVRNQPNVDPWLADMITGDCYKKQAWRDRGTGFAHTVTEDGMQIFADFMQAASVYYVAAWDRHPEVPNAAVEMIEIVMAGQPVANESARFWFDRAVEAQLDYTSAYTQYLWNLRPRWGGSHQQMIEFGIECLETDRFDTSVPGEFIVALNDVASELRDPAVVYQIPVVFEMVQRFYEGKLEDSAAKEPSPHWLNSQYLGLAWLAGREDLAEKLFSKLRGKPDPKALIEIGVDPKELVESMERLTGRRQI